MVTNKRKISILGSTGSIGTQALEVIDRLQDKFEVVALACGNNTELLKRQCEVFKPKYVCSNDAALKIDGAQTLYGAQGLNEICSNKENSVH